MSAFTAAFASCFNATAYKVVRVSAVDDYGAEVETLTVDTTAIPGCLQQMTAAEIQVRSSIGVAATHRWYCAPQAALNEKDVLRVDGADYEISRVNDVQGRGEVVQVDVRSIADGGS